MSNIEKKLFSDLVSYKFPDAYFINQENDFNVPNSHQKKGWRFFVDGFCVLNECKDYSGSFTCDKVVSFNPTKKLIFTSFTKESGINFLKFINAILNGDPKIFLHLNGLEVFDLRKKMFDIEEIQFSNMEIDALLLDTIAIRFSKLKKLEIRSCKVKRECNFNKIRGNVEINSSFVEDIRVFNDTSADISISRSHVEDISNTTILSTEFKINIATNIDIKSLFLKCNFPNLETLTLEPQNNSTKCYSYENQLLYLPKSAPKLENLIIDGKVKSFDFIMDIKNLLNCQLESVYDVHGMLYPDVSSSLERKNFFHRNKKNYTIQKILNPDLDDKYLLGTLELQRILRLAQLNKNLSYEPEEKNELLKKSNSYYHQKKPSLKNGEITKFYESYFDKLYFKNTENDSYIKNGLEDTLGFLNGFIYTYRNNRADFYKKNLVIGKNFMYRYDGTPIIFKNGKRMIETVDQALEFRKKFVYQKGWDIQDLENNEYYSFIDYLKELQDTIEEDISVGVLMEFSEFNDYHIKGEEFKKFGISGNYVAGIFEKYNRLKKRENDLEQKNQFYRSLLNDLILENYDQFTFKEKIFLYFNITQYSFCDQSYYPESNLYDLKGDYDEFVLENINLKTMGLYAKYFNMLKLTYKQNRIFGHPYDLTVKKDYIKRLELINNKKI